MNEFKIGIVVADSDEYAPLEKKIESAEYSDYKFLGRKGHSFKLSVGDKEAQIISILCGIGKVNAAAAAMHLIDKGCNIILNYGLSGGISGVSRGDICLPDRFLEHDFDLTGIGYKPCEKPSQRYIYNASEELISLFLENVVKAKCGTAVTGDRFVCDEALRIELKTQFSAMSCDMETAAIAYVCDFSNIPFLSVRRISDDAGDDASDSYRNMNTSNETLLSDMIIDFCKVIIKSQDKLYEK